MKPVDTFQNRLQKAISIRNIKPVELHEKTAISESLLSKYLSGNAIARQRKLTLLADALDVNEVWLMGYDIPMEKNFNKPAVDNNEKTRELLENYNKLNDLGKTKAVENVKDLTDVPKYIEKNDKKTGLQDA